MLKFQRFEFPALPRPALVSVTSNPVAAFTAAIISGGDEQEFPAEVSSTTYSNSG